MDEFAGRQRAHRPFSLVAQAVSVIGLVLLSGCLGGSGSDPLVFPRPDPPTPPDVLEPSWSTTLELAGSTAIEASVELWIPDAAVWDLEWGVHENAARDAASYLQIDWLLDVPGNNAMGIFGERSIFPSARLGYFVRGDVVGQVPPGDVGSDPVDPVDPWRGPARFVDYRPIEFAIEDYRLVVQVTYASNSTAPIALDLRVSSTRPNFGDTFVDRTDGILRMFALEDGDFRQDGGYLLKMVSNGGLVSVASEASLEILTDPGSTLYVTGYVAGPQSIAYGRGEVTVANRTASVTRAFGLGESNRGMGTLVRSAVEDDWRISVKSDGVALVFVLAGHPRWPLL